MDPVPLVLVVLSLLVSVLVPRVLGVARWPRRAPGLGILAWQSALLSVLGAFALLATTALLPVDRITFDVEHLLHACPDVLGDWFSLSHGSGLHLLTLLVASGAALALLRALVLCSVAVRRGRGRQRDLLDLLSRQRDRLLGVHVVDHEVPLAYCVPGAGGRVVVTTAAVAALDERQLTAVLAHEHAHLDGRHDLVLFGADVVASAFPWSRFFQRARQELRLLVEMLADDEASRRSDRGVLATALVGLSQRPAPEGALGAGGETGERLERLLTQAAGPAGVQRLLLIAGSLTLLFSPWIIALTPAWAARSGLCPLPGA